MDINPYAAPSSEVVMEAPPVRRRFYVVAPVKFFVLFFATLGAYQLYWHYQNWATLKRARRSDEWPVMRSIFSIFFTHLLFREIDQELRINHIRYSWKGELYATIIVLVIIGERILSRFSGSSEEFSIWDAVSMLSVPVLGYFLFQAQKAANHACSDPEGRSNANYTIANIFWIVLGGLFYLVLLLGLLAMMLPEA